MNYPSPSLASVYYLLQHWRLDEELAGGDSNKGIYASLSHVRHSITDRQRAAAAPPASANEKHEKELLV